MNQFNILQTLLICNKTLLDKNIMALILEYFKKNSSITITLKTKRFLKHYILLNYEYITIKFNNKPSFFILDFECQDEDSKCTRCLNSQRKFLKIEGEKMIIKNKYSKINLDQLSKNFILYPTINLTMKYTGELIIEQEITNKIKSKIEIFPLKN
jgi:hypothetical protein